MQCQSLSQVPGALWDVPRALAPAGAELYRPVAPAQLASNGQSFFFGNSSFLSAFWKVLCESLFTLY